MSGCQVRFDCSSLAARAALSGKVKEGSESRGLKWPFNPRDSDAALNAARARRAGMISYLPSSPTLSSAVVGVKAPHSISGAHSSMLHTA